MRDRQTIYCHRSSATVGRCRDGQVTEVVRGRTHTGMNSTALLARITPDGACRTFGDTLGVRLTSIPLLLSGPGDR